MEAVFLVTSLTHVVCFNKNSCPNFLITFLVTLLISLCKSSQGLPELRGYTGHSQGSHAHHASIDETSKEKEPQAQEILQILRKWTVFVPGPCHVVCSLRALTPVLPIVVPIVPRAFCYNFIDEYYNVIRLPRLLKLALWLLCTLAIHVALPCSKGTAIGSMT